MEDVVLDFVAVDDDIDSIRPEEIGFVRRINPTALKRNEKIPKVISSPLLKEAREDRSASGCDL
jgi:hypothetical protein